ncbi:MAG: hypothetical protein HY906_27935 [Deltaproteobacteria bacterium]|nr:hypothetical protein [Deltaproteobacteria bacterium]
MRKIVVVSTLAAVAACGGDAGTGTLAAEIWGEDFIEHGIPASEFADGWSVTFGKFLVSVGGLTLARGGSPPDVSDDTQRVFDVTRAGPFPILTRVVPSGRYDTTSYRLAPATAATVPGNCAEADLDLMRDRGYSVYVEGTAQKAGRTKTFRWAFATDTTYHACQSTAVVDSNAAASIQITIHGDHLFYDDLFSSTPAVTFEVVAGADADDDGEVTPAELQAFDIRTLPNYGTGSTGIDNLWDFVSHLTRTLGHIDGEGHCETR